jgi:GTP pyrophosphokinase
MTMLSSRFEYALAYATRLHADQRRKGSGIPYIAHLLAVCAIVLEYGGGEDEAIAALLHDAVEDQGGPRTREEIRRRFGEAVVAIVDACSDTDEVPKPPWRGRKEAYIARIAAEPAPARLVSAADKLHNARSILKDYREIGDAVWDRFHGGREGTLWYYTTLVDAFRAADGEHAALIDELSRVVDEISSNRRVANP